MEKRGFEPNYIIYNTLIDNYAKMNKLEGLFLEMKERDLHPTISTYNTLIDSYRRILSNQDWNPMFGHVLIN